MLSEDDGILADTVQHLRILRFAMPVVGDRTALVYGSTWLVAFYCVDYWLVAV
ncbi:hypothetical protein QBC36DRAFT_285908 [Triangularia setosa]|uniref:Uncharacterized protein n=1 Tax=Triangularia setosa TaxID=2587417 RepID=A0AAN6WJE3_9PEZI|nr:hypothetical protein QBC36DRAFT_285908 [Podospora setosa]